MRIKYYRCEGIDENIDKQKTQNIIDKYEYLLTFCVTLTTTGESEGAVTQECVIGFLPESEGDKDLLDAGFGDALYDTLEKLVYSEERVRIINFGQCGFELLKVIERT